MMITIRGLPLKTRYQDVKLLLKSECQINDFILDNLVTEKEGFKAVRVGLAQDSDGHQIMKCLKGYRMSGNLLNVEPVGKTVSSNPPHQDNYEHRPTSSYPSQPRIDYNTENRSNYPGQVGSNYSGGSRDLRFEGVYPAQGSNFQNPTPSQGPTGGPGNVQSSWVAQTQWTPNQTMNSQNNYAYQQPGDTSYSQNYSSNPQRPEPGPYVQNRAQNDPGFGFTHKAQASKSGDPRHTQTRPHVLRNVEIVDTPKNTHPVTSGRYPANQAYPPQEKPVTIMKDNFQGPTMYDIVSSNTQGVYQKQRHISPQNWTQQGQQLKPHPYSKSNPAQFEKKYNEVQWSLAEHKRAEMRQQPNRADVYKELEKPGTRFSPRRAIERSLSPSRRLVSPSRRRGSPARQVMATRDLSPRRATPPARGRRVSPSGRRFSPTRRLTSPAVERRVDPQRDISPRERAGQRRVPRFSPQRHNMDKPIDKNIDAVKMSKHHRPAYEVSSQAPNQAMYSGGLRSNAHENAPYPRGPRKMADAPWQTEEGKIYSSMKKHDDEGRGSPRRSAAYVEKHSPRMSRSPNRRDRSPIDRFRKHSASSRSPRRSWAFEKRRSPATHEAPPPPVWPGQGGRSDERFNRQQVAPKHVPVWESRPLNKLDDVKRPNEERESYVGSGKAYRGGFESDIASSRGDRHVEIKRDMKLGSRNEVENRNERYRQAMDIETKPYSSRQEREYRQSLERENRRLPEDIRRKEPLRREEERTNFDKLDKDFENVYKKAQQFKQQTEERKAQRLMAGRSEERGRSPRHMDEKEHRHGTATSPRRHVDHSPWGHKIETSRHRTDFSPRRREDDFDLNRMDKPRHKLDVSPRRDMEGVSRERRDVSPRNRMDTSPRRRMDNSPHHSRTRGSREREPVWNVADENRKRCPMLPVYIKVKREKAADELAYKILNKQPTSSELDDQAKRRVLGELKKVIGFRFNELFGNEDVSFIELVIKFQTKVSDKETDRMFNDIIKSLPIKCRSWKSLWPDSSDMPEKKSVRSDEYNLKQETHRPRLSDTKIPDWKLNIDPPKLQIPTSLASMSLAGSNSAPIGNPILHQQLLTAPLCAAQNIIATPYFEFESHNLQMDAFPEQQEVGYDLYLRKEDFKPITAQEGEDLKDFIISELVKSTKTSQGWSPDFTFKGLHSMHRYVLFTTDEKSKFWLINLNFSKFTPFNVLVYTQEELWYERAAIWLPGHVMYTDLEPFDKIKLQNNKMESANIGKWKLVKKIVTLKGTRLYIDMPPSSARELEKHNMMLSYELHKVNVYLRAATVDKDAFDAGLLETSITDKAQLMKAAMNTPMPSIQDTSLTLKFTYKGSKTLSVKRARTIQESIIRQIFIHHRFNGISRTDFVSYGIIAPNYFGVVPENTQSKRWIITKYLDNRFSPLILVTDDDNDTYYKISVTVPNEHNITALAVLERIKQSNHGVGFNFNQWKVLRLKLCNDKTEILVYFNVDLRSIAKLIELEFQLDYMKSSKENITVHVKSDISKDKLLDIVKLNYKEATDNYDVANMDLDSGTDEDDVICLD